MRITYAKLVGYAGLYTGLGKTELELDFTKCRNHIVVISGANGCGKSTLQNALSVLPDGNDCFLPSMAASKQLQIVDQDVVYNILINHGLDIHGNRQTTKAYIEKNGIELNPNGNVSSYKDIIFDEFSLDNNFIALSYLSSSDRGLADKKPAERKKFLASITSSLDVYNDINKNLTKKANVYRNFVNNLSSKIQNIGNEASLRSTLLSLKNREDRLKEEIENLKQQITECKTILAINDPNGQLQQKYDTVISELESVGNSADKCFSFIKNSIHDVHFPEVGELFSKEEIDSKIEETRQSIEDNNRIKQEADKDIIKVNGTIQNIQQMIDQNQIRINKLKSEINVELENQIKEIKSKMFTVEDLFTSLGTNSTQEIEDISSTELNQLVSTMTDIISSIDLIYENIHDNDLPKFVEAISTGMPLSIQMSELAEGVKNDMAYQVDIKNQQSELQKDLEAINELDNRPKNCKIDGCYFISKYQEVLARYSSHNNPKRYLENQINILEDSYRKSVSDMQQKSETTDLYKNWVRSEAILDRLRTLCVSNNAIFNKIRVFRLFSDFEAVLALISRGSKFNEYRDLSNISRAANDIIEYKAMKKIYDNLQAERKSNQNNIEECAELEKANEEALRNINTYKDQRDQYIKTSTFTDGVIIKFKNLEIILKDYANRLEEYNKLEEQRQFLKDEKNRLDQQFKGSAEILQKIADLQNKVNQASTELSPIEDQKKNIDTQIMMLDSYKREYQEYSTKYDIIDKLKKYSSPTAGGIQTLFMNLYMGQTLETANQLLGMLFQGQYQLMNYVINQDEFRIPFTSNGFEIDDISSGSTSQICMMGMIINLVLLHQASTKYNITRLDEIDGGLDSANRMLFVDILQRIIQILGIDQLFIISHSCESALSNVDAIQLAPIEGFEDVNTGANIIYSWRQ